MGIGRSGTSLLQEIMNTFEGFCNVGEALIDGVGSLSCYPFLRQNDFSYLETFIQEHWSKKYLVEKSPPSINFLPQLHERYPKANYIFLRRHPFKILLSQLSKFPREKAEKRMSRQYKMGLSNKMIDIPENYEAHKAAKILELVEKQTQNHSLFTNQITVRYEDIVKDVESMVSAIASKFNIKMNAEAAKAIISRPSYSSRQNTYTVKAISDPEAIELMGRACALWDYKYEEAI